MSLLRDEVFVTTLPADGYWVVLYNEEGLLDIPLIPVLAFLVFKCPQMEGGFSINVFPATESKVFDLDDDGYAVVRPDGTVTGSPDFRSIEELKEHISKEKAQKEAAA